MPATKPFAETVSRARAIPIENIISERGIKLKGHGVEREGPCPRCDGDDRFAINIKKQVFNCRRCGGKGAGAIDLVKFLDGVGFNEAIGRLIGEQPRPSANGHDKQQEAASKKIVAIYDYTEIDGTLLYQALRYEPKGFSQRRPDGYGGSINSLEGLNGRRVLYRWPDLEKYPDGNVFVCEGEKDADRVASLEHCATTIAGDGHWTADCIEPLKGRHVFILEDNDATGRKKALKAATALNGSAASIRIVRLPDLAEGNDVSDWLDVDPANAGRLADICIGSPAWKPTAEDQPAWMEGAFTAQQLQGMTVPPVSWIVPDMIPAEGVTLLCSKPKFGKSWLAYDLCIACTMGRFTLGTIKPAQGDVLYLALEDSKRRLQRRMGKLLPTFNEKWPDKLTITTEWRHLHEGGLDDIRAWYEQTKTSRGKPIMVTIDVLAKVRKPSGNKQLYEADYEAITGLTRLANELGIAIIVIHHTRKMAADDLMETVSGSFGVTGAVDTILVMAAKASGSVLDIRGRDVESAELAIQFSKDTCRWTILGTSAEIHVSDQRSKIIAALKEADAPMKVTELMEATSMKRNPIDLLLGKMAKDQLIQRIKMGLYAHKDYVPPPPPEGPAKPTSVHLSRSVSNGQMPQHPENKGKNEAVCPSVRSVWGSSIKVMPGGERIPFASSGKERTDQTYGQIIAQSTDKLTISSSSDLSGPQTDETEPTKH
jgi:hypothetical protein